MALALVDGLDFRVTINGTQVEGLIRASIVKTNCFSADTYVLTFSIAFYPGSDVGFWSALPSAYLELFAGALHGSFSRPLITGMVDDVVVNLVSNTVTIEGRDLTSLMIDSYRQQDFVNQTASEIVSTIALYHNLNPEVTSTSTRVGRYYGDGYIKVSLGQFSHHRSDWDLVVQLARENAFDVFVEGQSLIFQPASYVSDPPILISLQDVLAARIERSLNIGVNIAAKVQSWDSQHMQVYESDTVGNEAGGQRVGSDGLPFLFSGSNYTSQQVADLAERYSSEVRRLRTVLHLTLPWDGRLSPRGVILLGGTASSFDGIYRIESIERHYSTTSGSTQALRAIPG